MWQKIDIMVYPLPEFAANIALWHAHLLNITKQNKICSNFIRIICKKANFFCGLYVCCALTLR